MITNWSLVALWVRWTILCFRTGPQCSKMISVFCLLSPSLDSTIGFTQNAYDVLENAGFINVTVAVLEGFLDREVVITLQTTDGTAVSVREWWLFFRIAVVCVCVRDENGKKFLSMVYAVMIIITLMKLYMQLDYQECEFCSSLAKS